MFSRGGALEITAYWGIHENHGNHAILFLKTTRWSNPPPFSAPTLTTICTTRPHSLGDSMVYTLLSGPTVYAPLPCFPKEMVYNISFVALWPLGWATDQERRGAMAVVYRFTWLWAKLSTLLTSLIAGARAASQLLCSQHWRFLQLLFWVGLPSWLCSPSLLPSLLPLLQDGTRCSVLSWLKLILQNNSQKHVILQYSCDLVAAKHRASFLINTNNCC